MRWRQTTYLPTIALPYLPTTHLASMMYVLYGMILSRTVLATWK